MSELIKSTAEIELKTATEEPVVDSATNVREVRGLFKTVSTIPTKEPRSIYEQVQLYVSGNIIALYMYDTENNAWRNIGGNSGVYSPTSVGVTNVEGTVDYECQYMRVGNVVTVSGQIDINPTATGETRVGIPLPIASNFGANTDCAGTASDASGSVTQNPAGIIGDATNNRAEIVYLASSASTRQWSFHFTYQII